MSKSFPDPEKDRAPLLGGTPDLESGHRHTLDRLARGRSRRCRLALPRWIVFVAIGVVFFLLGLATHPPTRSAATVLMTSPQLDDAVRVRVLKGLLEERYPFVRNDKTIGEYNARSFDRLASCLEQHSCTPAEQNVVLLQSFHFRNAEYGRVSGEDVWARSMLRSLRALNYTLVFTQDQLDTLMIHQEIGDKVRAIVWEGKGYLNCLARNETNYKEFETLEKDPKANPNGQTGIKRCMQTADFPEGIPLWKSFVFHFWSSDMSALCRKWTLAPEDYGSHDGVSGAEANQYIGYSIEPRCMAEPMFSEREHRALVLAKRVDFFDEPFNKFHGMLAEARDAVPPFHDSEGNEFPFQLISTAGSKGEDVPEPGLSTLGKQDQLAWTQILGRSKILLGIGSPKLSPSPYDALCIGVPFINVILQWKKDDPDNRDHWFTQTDALKHEEEPYVYHVRQDDKQGLIDAMTRAAATPIGRYIPPKMRTDAVRERTRLLIETDWLAEAGRCVETKHKDDPKFQYILADAAKAANETAWGL